MVWNPRKKIVGAWVIIQGRWGNLMHSLNLWSLLMFQHWEIDLPGLAIMEGHVVYYIHFFDPKSYKWKPLVQEIGPRDISDHCVVWIKPMSLDWGIKPFKVNKCWLEHENFMDFVKEWEYFHIRGKRSMC